MSDASRSVRGPLSLSLLGALFGGGNDVGQIEWFSVPFKLVSVEVDALLPGIHPSEESDQLDASDLRPFTSRPGQTPAALEDVTLPVLRDRPVVPKGLGLKR
jgi:hypothetical protein